MNGRKKPREIDLAEILQNQHMRKTLGLSISGLAELIGVDRSTLYRWETGEAPPRPYWRKRWRSILVRRMKRENADEDNKQEPMENSGSPKTHDAMPRDRV